MQLSQAGRIGLGVLIIACAYLEATPAQAQLLTQRCNWGVGFLTPTVWPTSTQVMMMPTVMDLGGKPFGTSKVAFVSFRDGSDSAADGHGVLRIIDSQCNEIARFPDPNIPQPIPTSCLPFHANLNTVPQLSPLSGLALGNIDATPEVEIIGVLDDHATQQGGIIAFRLVAGALVPQWCSQPLLQGNPLPPTSAPAIAQLDKAGTPAALRSEIIVDNRVFEFNGALRYSGSTLNGNNCATNGGVPCPRSRTAVVANLFGTGFLPQVITGRGIYRSFAGALWTGALGWLNPTFTNSSLNYPAVAELEPSSPGPEIVVTDTQATNLRVLSATGNQFGSIALPNPNLSGAICPNGGGPPMIGNVPGVGTVIGVASCSRYTVFRYGLGLTALWSKPIYDLSGQATSTLFNTSSGPRIYYADQYTLWVFDAATGTVIQSLANSSGTAIEGPVVAALDTGPGLGSVIVAANNYWCPLFPPCLAGGQQGIRIFDDPTIGRARSYWNQHSYHATNVTNSLGAIPIVESPSWLFPARNTYRVQQWP